MIIFLFVFVTTYEIFPQIKRVSKSELILANQYEKLGDYEQALKIYKSLYRKNPADAAVFEGIKRSLMVLKRYDEAIRLVQSDLQRKYSSRNHADLATFYFKKGDDREAYRIWNQVIEKNPKDAFIYRTVGTAMIKARLFNEAIDVYKRARKNVKPNDIFMLELANLYAVQSNYQNAVSEYLNYLGRNPGQYNFIERSIMRFTDDSDATNQIIEAIRNKVSQRGEKLVLRQLLASLYMRTEQFDAALREYKLMDEVKSDRVKKSKKGKDLLTFANDALQDAAYPYAEQAYSLILEKYPNSPYRAQAKYGLARTYHLEGNYQNALMIYSELVETYQKSYEAQNALYRIGDIKLNIVFDPAGARNAYQKILKHHSRSQKRYEAIFKIGETYSAEGDFERARACYQKPLKERKLSFGIRSQSLYRLALLDFGEEKWDDAIKKLDKIVKSPPKNKSGEEQKLVNDALELILLIEESRNSKEAFSLYSQTILLENRRLFADAVDRLNKIVGDFPKSSIADEALLKISKLEHQQKNFIAAIAAYRKLITDYPDSYYCDLAQKRIAEIYESDLGEVQQAQREYEQFMVQYPRSLYLEEVRKRIRSIEKHL